MACNVCCCKPCNSNKSCVSCLGRCYLPKHKCETKRDIRPGPVPKCMGWNYAAKNAPEHQLKCGWRPGHISYPVLHEIEAHYSISGGNQQRRDSETKSPKNKCPKKSCPSSVCIGPKCLAKAASKNPCIPAPCTLPCCAGPSIRIVRHNGTYTIATKPSNMDNSPSGSAPLKYVFNNEPDDGNDKDGKKNKTKYSIEAKFNDNQFDYVSSNTSFVLDFLPPNGPPCGPVCGGSCALRKPSCPGLSCC